MGSWTQGLLSRGSQVRVLPGAPNFSTTYGHEQSWPLSFVSDSCLSTSGGSRLTRRRRRRCRRIPQRPDARSARFKGHHHNEFSVCSGRCLPLCRPHSESVDAGGRSRTSRAPDPNRERLIGPWLPPLGPVRREGRDQSKLPPAVTLRPVKLAGCLASLLTDRSPTC